MRPIQPDESFVDLHFPSAGVDQGSAFSAQPNRPVTEDKVYARSCRVGENVRGYEPVGGRVRGGSRPGIIKYVESAVVSDWLVQELNLIVTTGESPVQISQSGRVVTLIAVVQGNVYALQAGQTTWTQATNNTGLTPPLNFIGVMQSTALNQRLWFADGTNWVYYRPDNNSVNTWAATAGTLPVDSDGNLPRLITTWRGRIVLSGLLLDPQDIFFAAVGEPTDFDYSPLSTTPTQAVALSTGATGIVGDVITGLIPYTDDVLVILADSSVWMLRGDPMAGGQLDLVSRAIGGAWGQAWTQNPYGTIYFVSNRTGIYSLTPGQQPIRISQAIEQELLDVNTGTHTFRMMWNDRFQGLHVFITTTAAPAADRHLFWEQRSGAWWVDTFKNNDHNPLAMCTFDGNEADDRVPLIGSWDGYVRALNPTATTDDGYDIESDVVIGPLLTRELDTVLFKDIQPVLAETSGEVTFSIYVGKTAQAALTTAAVATGTWKASRGLTNPIRRSNHALYVRITSTNPWQMEQIRARIATQGKVQRRGR